MEVAHQPIARDWRTVESVSIRKCFGLMWRLSGRKLMMGRHSPDFLEARKNVEEKPWILPWGRAEMAFFLLRERISFSKAAQRLESVGTGVVRLRGREGGGPVDSRR